MPGDDAYLRFGVQDVRGRDNIVATLKRFHGEMETSHRILEYWDGNTVKFLRARSR